MEKFTKYDEFRLYRSYELSYEEIMFSYDDYFNFLQDQMNLFNKQQRWKAYKANEYILDAMECARN